MVSKIIKHCGKGQLNISQVLAFVGAIDPQDALLLINTASYVSKKIPDTTTHKDICKVF